MLSLDTLAAHLEKLSLVLSKTYCRRELLIYKHDRSCFRTSIFSKVHKKSFILCINPSLTIFQYYLCVFGVNRQNTNQLIRSVKSPFFVIVFFIDFSNVIANCFLEYISWQLHWWTTFQIQVV